MGYSDSEEVSRLMKACPCCGDRPELIHSAGKLFPWRIKCKLPTCGIQTPEVRGPWIALHIWNKRSPRPAIRLRKGQPFP